MNKKIVLILTWCLFVISSCSTYEDEVYVSPVNNSFSLIPLNYEGEVASRSEDLTLHTLSYYILDEQSQIVQNISITKDESSLVVKQLLDGDYFLIVLAEKAHFNDPNLEIHTLSSGEDKWLSIDPSKPIGNELFYAKHSFEVRRGVIGQSEVFLKRIVARLDFDFDFSEYTEGIVDSIIMTPDNQSITNTFYANNSYAGESLLDPVLLTQDRYLLLFPNEDIENFTGTVRIVLKSDGVEPIVYSYSFSTSIYPNKLSKVTINATQVNEGIGTLFVKKDGFNETHLDYVLKDDEPKDVYTKRKFKINQPMQVSINEDKQLNILFYSPVGISDVRIFGKLRGVEEQIEIANFEHLPAFADINIPLTLTQREALYRTESGEYLKIPKYESFNSEHIEEFKVVCTDPYMEKVKQFRVSWSVSFMKNGNSDLPNGGPVGNWMGIRPVHCREAIAILTNSAYMFTLEDFKEFLYTFQGRIKDNNGKDILDLTTVIPRFERHSGFDVGLVYTGNGVLGLGGGRTWGVYQGSFFDHYSSTYACNTIFHEFGHCIGFGHDSGMTYGPWAEQCAGTFYVNNLKRFPVNSHTYLNSNDNPSRY